MQVFISTGSSVRWPGLNLGAAVAFWVMAPLALFLNALSDLQFLRACLGLGSPGYPLGECQVLCAWLNLHLKLECNRVPPIASSLLSSFALFASLE